MTTSRISAFALALAVAAALWAPAAQADEAATIYDPSTVFLIDLTLSAEEEAKLEAEPDKYVKGTFSMTKSSDGTPAGEEATPFIAPRPVEVRLKGSVGGSFRKLSEKPGLKLKFKSANAVLGLRKMTLNNMVQDPSMLHEALAYASFRAAGVPASRTGFAYVRLNGNDIGVYLDLENLDGIALGRIFGTPFDDEAQHLYEGEKGSDVFPGGETSFEVDEGSEADISDLEALVTAVNGDLEEGESWSEKVAPNADLAEMTKMWAVEKYIDHWDGYSGHAEPSQAGERPNNYYLYSEATGRFQMLPWGTDQAWVPTIDVETPGREVTFDGPGGILFNKCLEDEECFNVYWQALRDATDAIAALDPQVLAEDIAGMLASWQAKEIADGRPEYDATEIKEDKYGVDTTLAFMENRRAEAETWLAENKPPEPEPEPQPIVDTAGPGPNPPAKPAEPSLLFERAKRSGRQLTTRVQVSAPGQVGLRATFKVGKKQRRACTTSKRAQAAGELVLHCKLSNAATERLASGALRLRLTIAIALAGGGKETATQNIRLARG
ncbi:MAG TPA: CotH kinase family protein [Solirubrobacterales bacterium]|nr:CotH kinase family protein [Solirubrobacterales bacterium]